MRYVCPEHPDVVLFENGGDRVRNVARRALLDPWIELFDIAFGPMGHAYIPSRDRPKQCPKDGKWYYKHECEAKP
jgi:hypothetical protein